jgi:hypothetical protein
MKDTGCRDTDSGLNDIRKELASLGSYSVKAGIVEGAGDVDGVSIARYASWNEYGVPGKKKKWKIPSRPFIRGWLENRAADIKRTTEMLYKQVADGKMDALTAIGSLGEFAQAGIRKYIRTGAFKENADITKERKKSSKPLIDTMTMLNSVRYQVTKDGK